MVIELSTSPDILKLPAKLGFFFFCIMWPCVKKNSVSQDGVGQCRCPLLAGGGACRWLWLRLSEKEKPAEPAQPMCNRFRRNRGFPCSFFRLFH